MRVIQCGVSLFQFLPEESKNALTVIRINKEANHNKIKRTILKCPTKKYVHSFSLASMAECIILTGGDGGIFLAKNDCHAFNTKKGTWDSTTLPNFNTERLDHSSLAIDNKVFIFGGRSTYDDVFSSIEMLGLRVNE